MCQLNLYLIPKIIPAEEVVSIFKSSGLDICLDTYYKLDALTEKYNCYAASYRCDCGSIISKLKDDETKTFDEYKIKKKNDNIEKLKRMKALKAAEDYDIRVREYEAERDRLQSIANSFRAYIHDYETEEFQRIKNLNISEKEKVKMVDEALRSKHDELEKNEDYQKALSIYWDFSDANRDLGESIYYNIEENEKMIESYNFSDFYDQYNNLKNAFTDILKLTEEICIYPFWQDEEPMIIVDRSQIAIDNLTIGDLAYLPYRNLLTVRDK